MITDTEIARLQGLTETTPIAVKLGEGQMTLLHARWFVLELPTNMFSISQKHWEEEPLPHALEWRTFLPSGEGAYGVASRFVNPKDNDNLVRLIADTGIAIIQPAIYDVVLKQISEPEFRVFPEEKAFVAILQAGALIGATAQVTL